MQDQQYDISPEMLKLFRIKEKNRMAAKEYYQNFINNPHRPMNDGHLFDASIQRYHAMTSYHPEIWKPSPKSYFKLLAFFSPFVLFYYLVSNERNEKEKKMRSGILNSKNRTFRDCY